MEQTEVLEKVKTIIKPYCKNEEALTSANFETKILQELGVNSARLVDIILDFEDNFDIEIPDEDADNIQTIGDAIKLIQQKI